MRIECKRCGTANDSNATDKCLTCGATFSCSAQSAGSVAPINEAHELLLSAMKTLTVLRTPMPEYVRGKMGRALTLIEGYLIEKQPND